MGGHRYDKPFLEVFKFLIFKIVFGHLKKFKFHSKWVATSILSHSIKFWKFSFFGHLIKFKFHSKWVATGILKPFCKVLKFFIFWFKKKFKKFPIFPKSNFFIFWKFFYFSGIFQFFGIFWIFFGDFYVFSGFFNYFNTISKKNGFLFMEIEFSVVYQTGFCFRK